VPIHNVCLRPRALSASKALLILGTLSIFFSAGCSAQDLVPSSEIPAVNRLIDSGAHHNSLKCDVQTWSPFLDFNFRNQATVLLAAGLNQFRFGEQVVTYLRITPDGASPVFLSSSFKLPSPTPEMNGSVIPNDLKHTDIRLGSAFNLGEGRYSVELLFMNQHGGSCYKKWNLRVEGHSGKAVPQAMSPKSVLPIVTDSWDGQLSSDGVRLTVLLDAGSVRQNSSQLYPWDRSLLLQSLASLLRGVRCQSVRVIAFSLEQQREIFRQQQFDTQGFEKLSKALEGVGLDAVPYQALMRSSQSKFLSQLAQDQISANDPPNAIVFLGPMSPTDQPTLAQPRLEDAVPSRFFYLEFHPLGAHFPDSIEYLTKRYRGSVFGITSPNDLASAIHKLAVQLGQGQ
jgi:hypothetical protein